MRHIFKSKRIKILNTIEVIMELIYAGLLLHAAKKEINEANLKKVVEAAGIKVDDVKIKSLVNSLKDVNIEEAIKSAAIAAPAAMPAAAEGKKEEKKEEKSEEQKAEEAASGLAGLFG